MVLILCDKYLTLTLHLIHSQHFLFCRSHYATICLFTLTSLFSRTDSSRLPQRKRLRKCKRNDHVTKCCKPHHRHFTTQYPQSDITRVNILSPTVKMETERPSKTMCHPNTVETVLYQFFYYVCNSISKLQIEVATSLSLQRHYSPGWASASLKSFLHPSWFRATTVQFLHPSFAA
jgi:predicted glycoside hydrolase/deacetylase ChbG (UPF0249 family)